MSLAAIFTDRMVLQRRKPICIFGEGHGEGTVTLGENTVSFHADGDFRVFLPPMEAGGPYTLTFALGEEKTVLNDILLGDVYLCAGQSNMGFSTKDAVDIPIVNNENIRYFREGHDVTFEKEVVYVPTAWQEMTVETAPGFSAVATGFAVELYRHTGVPIGLVADNAGASRIDAWTAPEIVDAPDYQKMVAEKHPDWESYPFNQDHLLYLNKLLPIVPYTMCGVLWYQGESNRLHAEAQYYSELLKRMIANWRDLWQEPLPFYMVQIMPYREGPNRDWYSIREGIEWVSKSIPATYMVTCVDTEEEGEIHPTHKNTVSVALAKAVAHNQFGENEEYCGPVLETVCTDGNRATLTFSHADGMYFKDGEIKDFYVTDSEGNQTVPAVTVNGNQLLLSWDASLKPVKVEMGYRNVPTHTLYNKAGYWASAFCRKL